MSRRRRKDKSCSSFPHPCFLATWYTLFLPNVPLLCVCACVHSNEIIYCIDSIYLHIFDFYIFWSVLISFCFVLSLRFGILCLKSPPYLEYVVLFFAGPMVCCIQQGFFMFSGTKITFLQQSTGRQEDSNNKDLNSLDLPTHPDWGYYYYSYLLQPWCCLFQISFNCTPLCMHACTRMPVLSVCLSEQTRCWALGCSPLDYDPAESLGWLGVKIDCFHEHFSSNVMC